MSAGRRLVGTLAVVGLVASGACAAEDDTGVAVGIVVEVDGDLSSVSGFTISTGDGDRMTFVPAPDGEFGFPLPHLQDHLRSGAPVAVAWARDGGTLWAIGVDDADDSPH